MPKRAEEVRFRADWERETVPEGETCGLSSCGVARWSAAPGAGVEGWEPSDGGVGLVRLRPNGRRGMGRSIGGLFSCSIVVAGARRIVRFEDAWRSREREFEWVERGGSSLYKYSIDAGFFDVSAGHTSPTEKAPRRGCNAQARQ